MKRFVHWTLILTAFGCFGGLLLFGTRGGSTTVAQAATYLAPSQARDGSLVIVSAPRHHPWFNTIFGLSPKVEVCWLTKSQLRQAKQEWRVSRTQVKGHSIINVRGATAKTLRKRVSGSIRCVLVHRHSLFFLPLDGSVS